MDPAERYGVDWVLDEAGRMVQAEVPKVTPRSVCEPDIIADVADSSPPPVSWTIVPGASAARIVRAQRRDASVRVRNARIEIWHQLHSCLKHALERPLSILDHDTVLVRLTADDTHLLSLHSSTYYYRVFATVETPWFTLDDALLVHGELALCMDCWADCLRQ